jgi:hypothetical protein
MRVASRARRRRLRRRGSLDKTTDWVLPVLSRFVRRFCWRKPFFLMKHNKHSSRRPCLKNDIDDPSEGTTPHFLLLPQIPPSLCLWLASARESVAPGPSHVASTRRGCDGVREGGGWPVSRGTDRGVVEGENVSRPGLGPFSGRLSMSSGGLLLYSTRPQLFESCMEPV